MMLYLVQGIGFGLAAAAQPGPLQMYLISQSLTRGWRRTLLAAFAPLVSDTPVVLLCLFLLRQLPQWFAPVLNLVSGVFVLYLAYGAFKTWRDFKPDDSPAETQNQNLFKAAFVNLLSPGPYLFWSLIIGPLLLKGWDESPAFGVALLIGFYATFILSLMLIIVIFGTLQRFGVTVQRALLAVSAFALLGFGVWQVCLGVIGNL